MNIPNNLTSENSLFVDVRDPEEFVSAHDERSVNISMAQIFAGKLDEIKNSKKENIVFVCASGGRSELAKIIVQEKILEKNMYNLYAWENLENVK